MPVLDIAANQIHAQPVTAYNQGKALRLAEQMNQRKMEMAEEEMQMARRSESRAEETHQAALSENHAKKLREFVGVAGEAIRKGDYESANTLSQEMFGEPLPEEMFKSLQSALPAEEEKEGTFGTSAKTGVNPETGQTEYFVTDKKGNVRWLGMSPEGTGPDGKKLAVERKLELVQQVRNKTGEFSDISDEDQQMYLDALDVQMTKKGSITLNLADAESLAERIIDETEIKEGFFGGNDDDFQLSLAVELMRLAKDGSMPIDEMKHRALSSALGYTYEEVVQAMESDNEERAKGGKEPFNITEYLKELTE